jgi:hypothetical protein
VVFPWGEALLFMLEVLLLALYGLTASGHFPREVRAEEFKRGKGAVFLWATVVAAGLAGALSLVIAWATLPWYAIVIGGGAMVLIAPLLLRPFPDGFVNGRPGLMTFAAGAVLVAAVMWVATLSS